MSNGRQLFVVAVILATFGALVVAGGPALNPGEPVDSEERTNKGGSTGADESTRPAVISECAATPPDDHADPVGNSSDTVGWVDGYWYDEELDIERSDGLNGSELEQVSARAAARFEAIRCLTADEGAPPVEIQTREQFRENQSGIFNLSQQQRSADNAELAIRLLSGTETDSVDEREQNRGAAVAGTYNFLTDQIVIVSDDPENLTINEGVLAHEIGHAIQDQQFDLIQYNRETLDRDKAILGLIEGDVHYVEQQYNEACANGDWEHGCLSGETTGEGGESAPPTPANWGLLFETLQPYNDGPAFVNRIYETGNGWESVDEVYDSPPTSALEVIRPERYPGFEPTNLTVPDRSSAEWDRYNGSFGPGYEQVGVAGIAAMFISPTFDSETGSIYSQLELTVREEFRTYQYLQPETEGWRGDRLYTYRGERNETGALWRTTWETPEDREPFVESYEELIDIRGGEEISQDTYVFGNSSAYDMALEIRTDGTQVTIVTAPSVDQLDDIHAPL